MFRRPPHTPNTPSEERGAVETTPPSCAPVWRHRQGQALRGAAPLFSAPPVAVARMARRLRRQCRLCLLKGNDLNKAAFPASVGPLSLSVRSVSPHMYRNGCGLAQLSPVAQQPAECIRLAEAARTSEHRFLFIELAERWRTLDGHAACEGRLSGGALFRSSPQL